MCGATSEQKDMQASQAAFYKEMTAQYTQVFGKQQQILDALTKVYQPIFDKGPSQRGFSTEEHQALDTAASENVATNYANAKRKIQGDLAARGGSDFIPSGADDQILATVDATAAADRSSALNRIEAADWDTGRQIWESAAEGLGKTATLENPTGFAGAATDAGNAASKTANDIAQASNSIWGSVIGGLSGVAGAAVGGWTAPKPPAPKG